jgi:hypothetical protein
VCSSSYFALDHGIELRSRTVLVFDLLVLPCHFPNLTPGRNDIGNIEMHTGYVTERKKKGSCICPKTPLQNVDCRKPYFSTATGVPERLRPDPPELSFRAGVALRLLWRSRCFSSFFASSLASSTSLLASRTLRIVLLSFPSLPSWSFCSSPRASMSSLVLVTKLLKLLLIFCRRSWPSSKMQSLSRIDFTFSTRRVR